MQGWTARQYRALGVVGSVNAGFGPAMVHDDNAGQPEAAARVGAAARRWQASAEALAPIRLSDQVRDVIEPLVDDVLEQSAHAGAEEDERDDRDDGDEAQDEGVLSEALASLVVGRRGRGARRARSDRMGRERAALSVARATAARSLSIRYLRWRTAGHDVVSRALISIGPSEDG